MRQDKLLFYDPDLDTKLRSRQESVKDKVDNIPKDQFRIYSDQEIVDHVEASLLVEPIVLLEEKQTMEQSETHVDVSHDGRRLFLDRNKGPVNIPGIIVHIDIPFTGDEWIFRYRTNPWSSSFPRGDVKRGHLQLTMIQPHDVDSSAFKTDYEREIALVRKCVSRAHKQISDYNGNLPQLVLSAVRNRRKRLKHHEDITSVLNIPMTTKSGMPSIESVKTEVRQPKVSPVPQNTPHVQELGDSEATFDRFLHSIRHQGRTFEQTPRTFAVHGEEDLRDFILAHLNGQFRGEAAAEVFRRRGKTDICMEQQDRSALVAECKIWRGWQRFKAALNQLMGYLTWRDTRATLIVFNVRNQKFRRVLETIAKSLPDHPLFLRKLPCEEQGEWRIQARSAEDESRRITVHIFAFNLYSTTET